MHSITVDDQNSSRVRINFSKERYSATSSSVITNLFNEQMCLPYKLKKAKQYKVWKTHIFADGIIVKFPGNVLPIIPSCDYLCLRKKNTGTKQIDEFK
jgi:hypothetical protein